MYNSDPARHFAISHQTFYGVLYAVSTCAVHIPHGVCASRINWWGPPDAGDSTAHASNTDESQLAIIGFLVWICVVYISHIEYRIQKEANTDTNANIGIKPRHRSPTVLYSVQCTCPESRAIPGGNRGIFSKKWTRTRYCPASASAQLSLLRQEWKQELRTRLTENGDRRTPGEPSKFDFPGLY
jgi:hypothetical protein